MNRVFLIIFTLLALSTIVKAGPETTPETTAHHSDIDAPIRLDLRYHSENSLPELNILDHLTFNKSFTSMIPSFMRAL